MAGVGIDVGDAVLHFLGDTTQLDAAFNRVADEAGAKLGPVNDELQSVAGNWQFAGSTASTAAGETVAATEEMTVGVERFKESTHEAKGELALLGELTGVHLPRHVRSFVAELPGVGQALNAAFAATAIFFVIEAIVEVTKKLSEFIADHFIYTEAAKESEKATAELNKQLLEQVDAYNKAKQSIDDFGKSAVQLAQDSLDKTTKELSKNQSAWRDAANMLYAYRNGIVALSEKELVELQNKYILLTDTIKTQQEQVLLLQKQHDKDLLDEQTKAAEVSIKMMKAEAEVRIQVAAEQARGILIGQKNNITALSAARADAAEKEYQAQLKEMKQRLSLLTEENQETWNKRAELQLQIEVLEKQHQLRLLKSWDDFRAKLAEIRNTPIPLITSPLPDSIVNDTTKKIQTVTDAASQLGVTLSINLQDDLLKSQEAFKKLSDAGVLTLTDRIAVQIEMIKKRISIGKLLGQNMSMEQKMVKQLQDQFDKMTGKVDDDLAKLDKRFEHSMGPITQVFKALISGSTTAGHAVTAFSTIVSEGIGQSVAAAVSGSSSFSQAMDQFLKSTLSSLSGQATVQAIVETAKGFAALSPTNPDFGHAHEHFASAAIWGTVAGASAAVASAIPSGAGSKASTTGGAGAAPNQGPVAVPQSPVLVQNVQRFAGGGLVLGPTLAMIGDAHGGGSQREAAIPLDDPRAIHPIVEALRGGPNGGGGPNIHMHVNGLVSPDNVIKVLAMISKKVKANQATLLSSNSLRVTRRSP